MTRAESERKELTRACRRCRAPAAPNRSRCVVHLAADSAANRKRLAAQRRARGAPEHQCTWCRQTGHNRLTCPERRRDVAA